jgi:hypothetical protein
LAGDRLGLTQYTPARIVAPGCRAAGIRHARAAAFAVRAGVVAIGRVYLCTAVAVTAFCRWPGEQIIDNG